MFLAAHRPSGPWQQLWKTFSTRFKAPRSYFVNDHFYLPDASASGLHCWCVRRLLSLFRKLSTLHNSYTVPKHLLTYVLRLYFKQTNYLQRRGKTLKSTHTPSLLHSQSLYVNISLTVMRQLTAAKLTSTRVRIKKNFWGNKKWVISYLYLWGGALRVRRRRLLQRNTVKKTGRQTEQAQSRPLTEGGAIA